MVYVEVAHVDVESVSEKFDQEPFRRHSSFLGPNSWAEARGFDASQLRRSFEVWGRKIGELVSTLVFFVIQR